MHQSQYVYSSVIFSFVQLSVQEWPKYSGEESQLAAMSCCRTSFVKYVVLDYFIGSQKDLLKADLMQTWLLDFLLNRFTLVSKFRSFNSKSLAVMFYFAGTERSVGNNLLSTSELYTLFI